MKLSLSQLSNLESKYTSAKKSVQRVREEAQATVMQVVRTVEVGGTAFSFGIVNGRWGRPEFVGVPVDLLTSIGLHGLGFVLDKEAAPHLHNLGDGALASYLTALGTGIGAKMLQESSAAALPAARQ